MSFRRNFLLALALFFVQCGAAYGVAHAAIANGMDASDMIGQFDDNLNDPQPVYGKSSSDNGVNILGLSLTAGTGTIMVDSINRRLFVPDTANNRILVYDLTAGNTLADYIPDYVLGQSVFYTNTARTTSWGLRSPTGLALDPINNRLFVADRGNNRILVFDVATVSTNESAAYVIGQSSFTSSGAATTSSGLRGVTGLLFDPTYDHLFVADSSNNRVLVFSGSSITSGMSAGIVLGQASFTASGAATTQSGMRRPVSVAFNSGSNIVYIADSDNHRVLTFTGSQLSNGMNAAKVLGQTSFTASTTATSLSKFNRPASLTYAPSMNYLFVADASNNRVLAFTGTLLTDGMSAGKVLGQTLFTTSTVAATQAGMNWPSMLGFDASANRLYVGQSRYHRVSIFDIASITNGENAADGLGQYDASLTNPQPVYTKTAANNAPSKLGIFNAGVIGTNLLAIDTVHHRLFVGDTFNCRVLVYNLHTNNTLMDRIPDYVLGQLDFHRINCVQNRHLFLSQFDAISYDPTYDRLFVGGSSRVLVYDLSSGITNGMSGSYVLGHNAFTGGGVGVTQSTFNSPRGMTFDPVDQRLFIMDSVGVRIMIFTFTGGVITNGMNASHVLGQTSFTASTSGTSASKFAAGIRGGLAYDSVDKRLFVADNGNTGNNRILVFDLSNGITNGMSGSYVLGQTDFTGSTGGVSGAGALNGVRGLAYDPNYKRLFASDNGNERVLVYDVSTITNGREAMHVIGQPSFSVRTAGADRNKLSAPRALIYDDTNNFLYVSDSANNRIMIFDVSPATSSSSASEELVSRGGGRRGGPSRGGSASSLSRYASNASVSRSASSALLSLFTDVPPSAWFWNVVHEIAKQKIVSGYADAQGNPLHRFGPADPVTVGQSIKIALGAAGHDLPIPAGIPRNPSATDWSAPYIAHAETLGLTLASATAQRPATRGEVIATLLEAFGIAMQSSSHSFTDLRSDHPHAKAILTAYERGFVTGDTDAHGVALNTVRPDDSINRAEVAALVVRMMRTD